MLKMFVLEARRAPGGVPLFGFDESGKFLQRGCLVEQGVQVGKDRCTGGRVVECAPQCKEGIRASSDRDGKARVVLLKFFKGHGLKGVPGDRAVV